MGKAPAFQLYAADFYMDTASWEVDTVGLYFRLLIYQWVNGSIPNDMEKIARIGGCINNRKWRTNVARMWREQEHKWVTVPGTNELINLRLEASRQEQDNFRKSQQESGKRGAEKRWGKRSDPNGEPISDPNGETVALQSSSSSSSSDKDLKAVVGEEYITRVDDIPSDDEEQRQPFSEPTPFEKLQPLVKFLLPHFPGIERFMDEYRGNGHIDAMEKTLLHLKKCVEIGALPKSPWSYCKSIMDKENGNYHARDHEKQHRENKGPSQEEAAKMLGGIMPKSKRMPS